MRNRSPANSADFVAAGAGADFQEHVAFVVGVLRQQQFLQLDFELLQARLRRCDFLGSANSRISGSASISCAVAMSASRLMGVDTDDHRLELGAFAGQLAVTVHVARGVFGAQQAVDLVQTLGQPVELGGMLGFMGSR